MNSETIPKDKDQAIREAMREEEGAINTYDELIKLIPEHASVFEEIKNDERDHLSKLTALANKVDPDKHESKDNETGSTQTAQQKYMQSAYIGGKETELPEDIGGKETELPEDIEWNNIKSIIGNIKY